MRAIYPISTESMARTIYLFLSLIVGRKRKEERMKEERKFSEEKRKKEV